MFFVSKICWSTLGKKSWVHFLLYLCWVDLMTDEEQKKHLTRLKQKNKNKKVLNYLKKNRRIQNCWNIFCAKKDLRLK
jgi:hypothetical protein